MKAPARLAIYAVVVVVLGLGAAAAGSAIGPIRADDGDHMRHGTAGTETMKGHDEMGTSDQADHNGHGAGGDEDEAVGGPDGLAVSEAGYTLALEQQGVAVGEAELAFRVVGPDGAPVRRFTLEHDKELHLIVVRRDLTGYQHLHPARDEAGTWRTPLQLGEPGSYRVFADFVPEGRAEGLTLGADLTVTGGPYVPEPLPTPTPVATVDGYEVRLEGAPVAGGDTAVELTVSKAGQPVTDLEPYLGAYGHLVALREGDLAYLHVHPSGAPGDSRTESGPAIAFGVNIPTPGSYRLFLDFRHAGQVRTAEFTVDVPFPPDDATAEPQGAPTSVPHDPDHAGH